MGTEQTLSAKALLVVVALGSFASAQPASGSQAEVLFEQGKQLIAAGRIAEACTSFEASQKIENSIATLLNLADCREKNHQLATSWGLFLEAARQARAAADAPTRNLVAVADARAAKLASRVSKLTIFVPQDSAITGLELRRNEQLVETNVWNTPIPVDGGTYRITARANRHEPWSKDITINAEGHVQSVDIPKLVALEKPDSQPPSTRPAGRAVPIVPILLASAAVLLGSGAVVAELSARSIHQDSRVEVDDAKQDELHASANQRRYLAEGLGVAAIGCAGFAIYLFIATRSPEDKGVAVTPTAGLGTAGLSLSGRW